MVTAENQVSREGERAHVTLLFSDLCDFTAFSEMNDPEVVDQTRAQVVELAGQIILSRGGLVTQVYGDGVLAVFGLPQPGEDDSRRAIDAALDLHAAVRGRSLLNGFELRFHSGVHSGLVLMRKGDALHGTFELVGDAVNTAARLAAAAERDEICVSEATLRRVEAYFATQPALDLVLKGKRLPVRAYRVTGRSEVRTRLEARIQGTLTPFSGRETELDALTHELGLASAGAGRVVTLVGPAGIGKTRLLEELRFRAEANGMQVLNGGCDSYGEVPALEPFLQIVRKAFRIRSSTSAHEAATAMQRRLSELQLEDHHATFATLLSLQTDAADPNANSATAQATFDALAGLLDALSAQAPLALFLDDWQWSDPISRTLLGLIRQHVRDRRVGLAIALRDDNDVEASLAPERSIVLEPFSPADSRRVIAALRVRDLDMGLSEALHERAGGNPLFLEELCHSLPDDVLGAQDLEQGVVPNTLQGLILARIAALDEEQRRVLRRASVLGIRFADELIGPADQKAAETAQLEKLVGEGLVLRTAHPGVFRFKHGITREVVYGSIRIEDRRRMHQEIANQLAQTVEENQLIDHSEALAFHYQGSGDYDRAATYAELAGDKASASSFLDPARRHYESALASLDRLELSDEVRRRWLRVSIKWAGWCAYAPARAQLPLLERADAHAIALDDNVSRAHIFHARNWFYYVFGDYTQCLQCCQEAYRLAELGQDQRLLIQLWTSLGQAYTVCGSYERALECLNRGIGLKRARASSAPEVVRKRPVLPRAPAVLFAHSLTCRAMIYADRGDFSSADADMQEALSIVQGTGHAMEPSVLSHQAIILIRRGDWAGARRAAERGRTTAERVNSRFVFGICSALESYSQWRLQPTTPALSALRRAVDWLEAREFGLFLSLIFACAAEALLESGEPESAASYATRAVERARAGDPQGEIAAYRVMARLAHIDPRHGSVSEWLRRAHDATVERDSKRELALTSLCSLQLQANQHGMLLRSDTLNQLQEMGMTWYANQVS